MLDTQSSFALNKFEQDAIICENAVGSHIRLTREDFSSEAEFQKWKKISDEDYRERERAGRSYYDHCISLNTAEPAGPSAEDLLISARAEREDTARRQETLKHLEGLLTPVMYRRLLLCARGLSIVGIAQREGVSHQAVSRCLREAKKRATEKL